MFNFPEEAHDMAMRPGEDVGTTDSGLWLVPLTLVFGRVDSPSCFLKGFLRTCSPCHEGQSGLVTWLEDDTELVIVAPPAKFNLVVLTPSDAKASFFCVV